MRSTLLLVAATACSCGASSAEVKKAHDASYQTQYQQVWQAVLAAVGDEYEIHYQDEKSGLISTTWKRIERTAESSQDNQTGGGGAVFFRAQVVMHGGPPWTPVVDGVAGELRAGLAVMTPFKHGAADEPPWVQARIDSLYVAIHERLQKNAVYGVQPGPPVGHTASGAPNADVPVAPPAPPTPAPGRVD